MCDSRGFTAVDGSHRIFGSTSLGHELLHLGGAVRPLDGGVVFGSEPRFDVVIGYRFDVSPELLVGFHLAVLVDELCSHITAHAVGLERGEHGIVSAQLLHEVAAGFAAGKPGVGRRIEYPADLLEELGVDLRARVVPPLVDIPKRGGQHAAVEREPILRRLLFGRIDIKRIDYQSESAPALSGARPKKSRTRSANLRFFFGSVPVFVGSSSSVLSPSSPPACSSAADAAVRTAAFS